MPLSAVLIVLNEEKRLERCLASLKFADEVIVVDGGSNDKTREIARAAGAKVFERKFDDFSSQRNFAASKASHDWVLAVDADESVTPELARSVLLAVSGTDVQTAFRVKRKTVLFGRAFRASGLQSDRPVRLYRRDKTGFANPVHEAVRTDGPAGELTGVLEHRSFQTAAEHLRRLNAYTSLEKSAETLTEARLLGNMKSRPPARFFQIYLFKAGLADGLEGFVYAVLSAYYEFIRWAKIWERGTRK